jgi:hypothetical protein
MTPVSDRVARSSNRFECPMGRRLRLLTGLVNVVLRLVHYAGIQPARYFAAAKKVAYPSGLRWPVRRSTSIIEPVLSKAPHACNGGGLREG